MNPAQYLVLLYLFLKKWLLISFYGCACTMWYWKQCGGVTDPRIQLRGE